MQENLYQNIDISQENPLKTTPESTPDQNITKQIKLPKNPKIIVLLVLFIIIILLSFTALIVTSLRQSPSPAATTTPTPLPTMALTPTPANTLIPTIYQEKFKAIEEQFNQDIDLAPPQIDTEIGL